MVSFGKKDVVPGKVHGAHGVGDLNDASSLQLPHVGFYKIDTDNLSLLDYYSMKDYYQIKTAFAMISFTLMSINWWIEGPDKEVREAVEWQIRHIWSDLMRTVTKAFWSGFSPNVKVFEVHPTNGYLYINKLRDLSPFACEVSIDRNDQSFDGFIQKGGSFEIHTIKNGQQATEVVAVKAQKIDAQYAFWYSFMKEDGNFEGQKLLKGAYMPWFFSQVIHLYVNRYFYRFSTPLAVGQAPAGYVEGSDGQKVEAQEVMISILKEIRNNSSVSLPSERDEEGNLIWDIKYLEAQMRGYDFESYLKRLDKEMARALFLPDLVFEAGKVGSYKLGELHKDTFLMLLNAIANDMKGHVDQYISKQFVENNFGPGVEVPTFHSEKQGTLSTPIIVDLISEMVKNGKIDANIEEIAKITGVPIKEAEYIMEGVIGEPTDEPEDKDDKDEETEKEEKVTVNVNQSQENPNIEGKLDTMLDEFKREMSEAMAKQIVEEDDNAGVKPVNDEFYDAILYVAANQIGKLGVHMDSNDRSKWTTAKLGYRSKLEKIWIAHVTEDVDGLYDSVMSLATGILSSGKSVGETKKILWDELTGFYLTMAFKRNPELAIGLANKVDSALNEVI